MKLRYSTIELDVLFARLALRVSFLNYFTFFIICFKEVPDSQTLDDDAILKNLDEKSVRSLNGRLCFIHFSIIYMLKVVVSLMKF